MTNSQRLTTIRAALQSFLVGQTTDEDVGKVDASIESESILIRGEFYCGRRFRTSTHHAVWFIEEDQLKIYTVGGDLCSVLVEGEIDEMAAQRHIEHADQTDVDQEDLAPHVISIHSQLDAAPAKPRDVAAKPRDASAKPRDVSGKPGDVADGHQDGEGEIRRAA
tara:strand:- start:35 stop:529 length:495 start_codon:yes stop_codon:yes gene_type:complete